MSKSLDNAIFLSDDPAAVEAKVMKMYTDPSRIKADVPGRIEGNPLFIYHDLFNSDQEQVEDLKTRYASGKVGDVEVKQKLAGAINSFLLPHRQRRTKYAQEPDLVQDVLSDGAKRMQIEAEKTLGLVREAMGLQSYKQAASGGYIESKTGEVLSGLAFL